MKKNSMITSAQQEAARLSSIYEHFNSLSGHLNENVIDLMESATHVLAGIQTALQTQKPLSSLGLSAASLAGVVSGIEFLTQKLPTFDDAKKTKALKVLGTISLGANMSLTLIQTIADLAKYNPNWKQIESQFSEYENSGTISQDTVKRLGKLRQDVDRAIQVAGPQTNTTLPRATAIPATAG